MNAILEGVKDRGIKRISPELRVSETDAGANVTAAATLGGVCAAGLGDGTVLRVSERGREIIARHDGAVTAVAVLARGTVVSAGQDGCVRIDGSEVFATRDGAWITAIDARDGTVAVAHERSVTVLDEAGGVRARFDRHPSTVSGVALSPDGTRLASARYNGVSIWTLADLADPIELEWRGSITDVSWSPDGRYVAAATQDRELHVWDLVTSRDYRLGGYQRKVGHIGWTADGDFLFSSGADVVVAWPLAADPGTMPPVEIGFAHSATASAVPGKGTRERVLAGFSNGTIVVGECSKGTAKIGRAADGDRITCLDWDATEDIAFYGTAGGRIGLIRSA